MEINFITSLIEKIPAVISGIREFFTSTIGLSDPTYQIAVAIIALVGSYYWIKQWITYSVFTKVSSILNWILLGLLLYVVFVYV